MSLELNGTFLTYIFLMLAVLFLPLPSTPYILYLFTTNSIFEAGLVFFLATTTRDLISYCLGFSSNKIKTNFLANSINYLKTNYSQNYAEKINKVAKFSKEKLNNATIREIIVARWLGVHPIIIAIGLGRLSSSLSLFFVPNTFYVIIDVTFYWILIGSGKIFFEYYFPGVDIIDVFSSQYFYVASLLFIVLFYIIY